MILNTLQNWSGFCINSASMKSNPPTPGATATDQKQIVKKFVPEFVPEKTQKQSTPAKEYGGRRKGLEPTRYGDWEKAGRCIDF